MMTKFVLGASDPEMTIIRKILKERGVKYVYATKDGKRVHPGNAYKADPVDAHGRVVFVECFANTNTLDVIVVDHHREGDYGYNLPPEKFWEASSLGQVCKLLGVERTLKLAVVAAADHCPAAAYQGKCPGVTPEALAEFRETSRASYQGISISKYRNTLAKAIKALNEAPVKNIAGVEVAVLEKTVPELPEAALRLGKPFMTTVTDRDGAAKVVIQAAPKEVIQEFLDSPEEVIGSSVVETYGVPERGYAGAYLEK